MLGLRSKAPEISERQVETMTELNGVLKTIRDDASLTAAKPKLEALSAKMSKLDVELAAEAPSSETYRDLRAQHEAKMKTLIGDLAVETRRIQEAGLSDKALADFAAALKPTKTR
ncbi:MAG: hypothetical protein QM811_20435 [Pirellulales bacterium]